VTITMPSGDVRVFQPDSRNGNFFSQTGDYGQLFADTNNSFTLRERNGQLEHFNADGTLGYIQDTAGNRITAGYSNGQLVNLVASSASLTLSYNSNGTIHSVSSSDGRTVVYTYESDIQPDATNEKQLISVLSYDGSQTAYNYNFGAVGFLNFRTLGNLTSITFADGSHEYFQYDSPWNRISQISRDGGADAVTFSYHQGFTNLEATVPTFSPGQVDAIDAANNVSQYYFDANGLLVKTIDPLGNFTFAGYDNNANLTSLIGPTGLTDTFEYDANGNLTSATNPLGYSTNFTYTGTDNLLSGMTDARGNTTTYTYDTHDNLTSIQNPDNSLETATYDALGDPLRIVNPNGQATSYTYNASGQIASATLADGSLTTFSYDARGNLISAVNGAGTTTLTYDQGDRLTYVSYSNGQFLQYTYDGGGRRIRMVDQSGFTVSYSYDSVGRLHQLTNGTGANIDTYSYNALGQLIREDKGNGTYTTYQYDPDGNILHLINYASGGSVNSRFDYNYNALNQVATMATLDGTWTYTYDTIGQLLHAIFASTNPSIPSQDLAYTYDAAGNRVQTIINGVTANYNVNSVNEYTSTSDGTTYKYDAAGNLIAKITAASISTYSYDSLNRLVGQTLPGGSFVYQYDALGNLSATIGNGLSTQNLVDPTGIGSIVAQYNNSGGLIADYAYGNGLVSQMNAAGTNYYQFDALGSTAGITSLTGANLNKYSYLPFGGLLNSVEGTANPFTFVGQFGVLSDGSGLYGARARFLAPVEGRFTSPDPIGLSGGDTNLYRYVYNQPTRFHDVRGTDIDSLSDDQLRSNFRATTGIYQNALNNLPKATAAIIALSARGGLEFVKPDFPAFVDLFTAISEKLGYKINPFDNVFNNLLAYLHLDDQSLKDFLNNISNKTADAATSTDPNALLGPGGFGSQHFENSDAVLPYEIDFENSASATAPAQQVKISNPLDPNVDFSTFQLTAIQFGNITLSVPVGSQHYQTTVGMTYNGESFNVNVEAGLNVATRTVYATFQSVNSKNGLPPDVLVGFLPPENETGRGTGYIRYSIQAKAGTPTGTQIRNVALVTFDGSNSIATDQVSETDPSQGVDPTKQALVTIDAGVPTSHVSPLAATNYPSFIVSWSGSDDTGGSGLATFDVFVSDNAGQYSLWQDNTTQASAIFGGQVGHTHAFYSVATDNVGNTALAPASAQATTTTVAAPLPDYNKNDVVDAADYVLWRKTVGTNVSPLYSAADGSGNGVINQVDYDVWRAHFGNTSNAGHAPPGTAVSVTYSAGVAGPYALAFDSSGNLYVANEANSTVSEFAPGSTTVSATYSTGVSHPYALTFDASGNLYVANHGNNTVSEFAPGSTTIIATYSAGVFQPQALAFDTSGNLYVANTGNNTVTKFAPGSTTNPVIYPASAGLSSPIALAFDSSGNLYVANLVGNTVKKFPPGSTTAIATYSDGLISPIAMAFDSGGNLYVANNDENAVKKFAPGSTTAIATYSVGVSESVALDFDSSGNLYVVNYTNILGSNSGNTVSRFAPGSTTVSATYSEGLYYPYALAFDSSGNLYVANYHGNTVCKFAVASNASGAEQEHLNPTRDETIVQAAASAPEYAEVNGPAANKELLVAGRDPVMTTITGTSIVPTWAALSNADALSHGALTIRDPGSRSIRSSSVEELVPRATVIDSLFEGDTPIQGYHDLGDLDRNLHRSWIEDGFDDPLTEEIACGVSQQVDADSLAAVAETAFAEHQDWIW
jgi:RHS repeat-associated protein